MGLFKPCTQDWPGCGQTTQTTQSQWGPGIMPAVLQTPWPMASPSSVGLAKRGTGAQHSSQHIGSQAEDPRSLSAPVPCVHHGWTVWGMILPLHHPSSSSSSATGMPEAVYPGLAAGQHSPMCLASGLVFSYKDHFLSLVEAVAQPGVPAGLVGEGGEKELCSCIAKVCLNHPCSASTLGMERPGAKHLL